MARRAAVYWVVAGFLSSCFGSGDSEEQAEIQKVAVGKLDLTQGVGEGMDALNLFSGPGGPTLPRLVQAIADAADDSNRRGFFLELGGASLSWAQAEEVGALMAKVRETRPVICHAHSYSNSSLWFAAQACSEIWLSPAGDVNSVGLAGQMVYVKRLLDDLGLQADFLHMGKYKSAAETLTQQGPSEAARESLLAVLQSIRADWLAGLKNSRKAEGVIDAVEDGPWDPLTALKLGLIDHIGYASDALESAKKAAGVKEVVRVNTRPAKRGAGEEFSELIRVLTGGSKDEEAEDRIVVLPTAGAIGMGSGGGLGGGDKIAAKSLSKVIRRLRDDDSVKAVVLRIDSPGGSALASDLLWHELMLLRDKKPLVASLAGTAASGGYYMACAAHRIFAASTSIVGSIGVVGGKIVIKQGLERLGVSSVTVAARSGQAAAARAAYLSPLSLWDEATRSKVQGQMAAVYQLFLQRVAEGRGMKVEAVHEVAQGRIWSGAQGVKRGLVDEIGGLTAAIAYARGKAQVDSSVEVSIEAGPESLMELLQLDDSADEATISVAVKALRSVAAGPLESLAAPLKPFVGSMAPLLASGETVVTALPYALTLD